MQKGEERKEQSDVSGAHPSLGYEEHAMFLEFNLLRFVITSIETKILFSIFS